MVKRAIDFTEKLFLMLIAGFTVVAMGQEILVLVENRKVALKDLLLMFIYAEVLGMLAAFYSRQRNLILLPLFIAMTALSRLIILQGKEADAVMLLYESGAILLIAAACWIISRMRSAEYGLPRRGRDGQLQRQARATRLAVLADLALLIAWRLRAMYRRLHNA